MAFFRKSHQLSAPFLGLTSRLRSLRLASSNHRGILDKYLPLRKGCPVKLFTPPGSNAYLATVCYFSVAGHMDQSLTATTRCSCLLANIALSRKRGPKRVRKGSSQRFDHVPRVQGGVRSSYSRQLSGLKPAYEDGTSSGLASAGLNLHA